MGIQQSIPHHNAQHAIPSSIALVDFSHMLTVNFHAAGAEQASSATLSELASIKSSSECTIVCLDSKPYWRKLLWSGYKEGRRVDPELVNIWERTIELVKQAGYAIAKAPAEEADDVMATLARIYSEEYGCLDVRLVTQDKDVLQVTNERVRQFYPITGKRGEFEIRGPDYVVSEYGVQAADLALLLAMMGDTSDKIPGIKEIGKKIGSKLITMYGKPGKHADTMLAIADALVGAQKAAELDGKLPAFWKNYAAGMAELPKWLKLTTLSRNAALELHPLKYLERVEPLTRVADDADIEREAIQAEGELIDEAAEPDWDRVAEETLRKEREAMASALPAGPAPRIGKDPNADAFLREQAEARERIARDNAAELERQKAIHPDSPKWHSGNGAPAEGSKTQAIDSGAPARSAASDATPDIAPAQSAGNAEVVAANVGPQKRQDEIRRADTTAAIVQAPSWALAAQPQSAAELLDIAKVYWNSRMFEQFGSHRGVFAVMSLGRELGMGYSESLEAFFVVNNKPFPKAKWILSRMQNYPDLEWVIVAKADDKSATIRAKHRRIGELLEYTYTIEDAQRAGLTTGKNRANWEKIPRNMLRARAISGACGDWCPGAVFALRSYEEALDE